MNNKTRQKFYDLFLEVGKTIADLNYWVKEFLPQTDIDFKKKWSAIRDYPKKIYLWNENAKELLKNNELLGNFIKDDEKIIKLKDIVITDDTDIDFYAFNDWPHYEDGNHYPSDFKILIRTLQNKQEILEKIAYAPKIIIKKSNTKIVVVETKKHCILKLDDKELKISFSSPGGQSLQSKIILDFFKKPRKYNKLEEVYWEDFEQDLGEPTYTEEKMSNAIYRLNRNSKRDLKIELFSWRNGNIKALI